MSLGALEGLVESSIAFGMRKALEAENLKNLMEEKVICSC
jgi:Axonemal dynein light chain